MVMGLNSVHDCWKEQCIYMYLKDRQLHIHIHIGIYAYHAHSSYFILHSIFIPTTCHDAAVLLSSWFLALPSLHPCTFLENILYICI